MVLMINQTLGKKRSYGEPTKRAPTLKRVCFNKKMDIVLKKNGYGCYKCETTFNKLSIFVFCIYTSKSSSTYAIEKFYLHFK